MKNNFSENIIIIPIYNDWKSLNKLLTEINKTLSKSDLYKILIINDCSTQEINIENKKFTKLKEIKILSLKKNLGSQKSLSIGLDYLTKFKKKFYITIMDGDGEDNPLEIKKLLNNARMNKDYIITSHRKNRNENFIIKLSYKIHLIISFFFTWHWISFGNFSCFNSINLKKLDLNDVWYAFSGGVLKNCKIKKMYASRQRRYFESSKVNFLKLVEHSFRIISLFYKRVLISSLALTCVVWMTHSSFSYLLYALIFLTNITLFFIKFNNRKKSKENLNSFIKEIKILM